MINDKLVDRMIKFEEDRPSLIHHFLKVYEYAHLIGICEGIDDHTQRIIELTSIVHDIGIAPCEKKFGHCDGKMQEIHGPGYAREMFAEFPEVSDKELERICFLIAHHHTYTEVDGIDYQILLEADFLVNAYEDKLEKPAIAKFRDEIFKTETGIRLLNTTYGL